MGADNRMIATKDIIALSLIIALFTCKLLGMDGLIDTSIALVIGYYFGRRNDLIETIKGGAT